MSDTDLAPPPTPIHQLYRQMWEHARGARARLAAALGLQVGAQMLKLALPWMAAQAINAIQTGGHAGFASAATWISLTLVLHLASWALHGPARVLERSAALQVRRSVADRLYGLVVQAPLAWHDRHHSGDLHHRVMQASGALSGFTQTQFVYLQNAIQLTGPLLALWWLSALTGSLALAGFVIIGTAVLRFDRALMALATQESHAERRYAARMLDFVGNISALASLRLQAATRTLLDARLLAVFRPLARSIVINEWKWCTVDLATVGLGWGLVVVYAATGGGSAGELLLIGNLFMVQQYAQQAAGVLCAMAANYQGLAHKQADFASADIIRNAPQTANPVTAAPSDWDSITLHDIDYAHDTGDASASRGGIHGVSLELRRGERLALVGPSGSGKSTLLRVLAGLYHAQAGHISIDGAVQPCRRHAAEWATLIPQEAEIFEATVRENLDFGQPVDEAALRRAVHTSALDDVLAGLPQGLETPMSERGFNLSGGQRQRLALARGVLAARDRSLLLLDEPTSALDPLIERHVQQRIEQAFAGACIVAAVHRLSLLSHFDRVVFMVAGRVVDVGTADELCERQPMFAAMCGGMAPVERPSPSHCPPQLLHIQRAL
jgi:ATP-binding cassette, subfamily B, bacterial